MSAFSSDPDLEAGDVTGAEAEVDVALNRLNGNIRLSILWTHEIQLSPDDAEQVARALRRAAEESRRLPKAGTTEPVENRPAPAKAGTTEPVENRPAPPA